MTRPTRTSYSALTTYETCPLSYKLYYLDHHKTEAGAAANRGTRLHTSCEKYFKDELPFEKLPIEFIKIRDDLKMMKALGAKAEEVWLVDENWTYHHEENASTRFKAVVDIHYVMDDHLFIFDLKTGREYPEHYDQLQSYVACGYAKYPHIQHVTAAPIYLEGMGKQEAFKVPIIPYIQKSWRERWDKLFAEVEWEATPGPDACRWCDYPKMGLCKSVWGRK